MLADIPINASIATTFPAPADFSKLLAVTALEIGQQTGMDWDPIFMIDKDDAEKNGVVSRLAYGHC